MKKTIFLLFTFFCCFLLPRQIMAQCPTFTDDVWYFGVGGYGIDFITNESGVKKAVNASGESLVSSNENSLSVSSPGCGSTLIFYSQHNQLYNAKHELMKNGAFSGNHSVADGLAACYIGDNKYMLIAETGANEFPEIKKALQYHIIDMDGDGGYGEQIFTGEIEADKVLESIELIAVPNTTNEYWLIYIINDGSPKLRVRKISGSSVGAVQHSLYLNSSQVSPGTYAFKSSKDGKLLSLVAPGYLKGLVFDFNPLTGNVSLKTTLSLPSGLGLWYGTEFSPNGKYIYYTTYHRTSGFSVLVQYDIAKKTFTTPIPYGDDKPGTHGGGLKLGPDGKIYLKRIGRYAGVINNPDQPLTAAGYNPKGFDFGPGMEGSTGLVFSTGLTPPALCPSDLSKAPVATDDVVTAYLHENVCVPVLANDTDPDGNNLTLANVYFLEESDADKLDFSFSIGGSTICVRPKLAAKEGDIITLRYTIRDDGIPLPLCSDANLKITISKYPDNISEAECFVERPATNWSIAEIPVGPTNEESAVIHNDYPLLVGDIDGDGEVEIISAMNNTSLGWHGVFYPTRGIEIHRYDKTSGRLRLKKSINLWDKHQLMFSAFGSGAIARYNNKGYIVIAATKAADETESAYLYAFDPDGNVYWSSTEPVAEADRGKAAYVNIADFNADGIPEIYVGNKIFSLATGELLCKGSGNSGLVYTDYSTTIDKPNGRFTTVADMDGDGMLNLVAGTQIYKVSIPQGATTTGSGTMSIQQSLTAALPANALADGLTQVVDIDNDGEFEVLVTTADVLTYGAAATTLCYAWKPSTNTVLGSYHVSDIGINPINAESQYSDAFSVPLIGDIDNDGYNEIVFVTRNGYAYALDFVPGNADGSKMELKWSTTHSDFTSGATGMSLFDFDQDGAAEIVYRDENTLRILDGSGAAPVVKSQFNDVKSNTLREFPVIADIDGDGQAEIIVSGGTAVYGGGTTGFVRVFKSENFRWAPARKVWNQYNYNAVNVNEDLTIPQYLFNSSSLFPGEDGILGNADDVRPYNNFMQQQTLLNKNGTPLWIAADVSYVDNPTKIYYAAGDSLVIIGKIINKGDAAMNTPMCISLYKNTVSAENLIGSDNYTGPGIYPNEEVDFKVVYTDFSKAAQAYSDLILRLNDCGEAKINQVECDTSNNLHNFLLENYWIGTIDSLWNNGQNWTGGRSPLTNENVEFATAANNNGKPAINDLYAPASLSDPKEIGKLINASDMNLIIPAKASVTVHGEVIIAENLNPKKIQIKAEADKPNGSFIVNCAKQSASANPDIYATVEMYAKGFKASQTSWTDNIPGSPTNGEVFKSSYHWQYFGVPVEQVNADSSFYAAALRQYHEDYNGDNSTYYKKWKNLYNKDMLKAFSGYEITQDNPTIYSIAGKLQYCDKTLTMTRKAPLVANASGDNKHYGLGQNLFGNSYTSSINVDKIEFPSTVEKTVYLYNTGSFSDWGNNGDINDGAQVAGQYTAIPQNTSSVTFGNGIPSMNAFLLKFTQAETLFNQPDASVTLKYTDAVQPNSRPQTAPEQNSDKEELSYLSLTLRSASTIDKLWLFSQEATTAGFDNGWDGRKFFATPSAFIYSETPDGSMQVSTNETIDGSIINFYANEDKEYELTISKSNLHKYHNLHLIDLKTLSILALNRDTTTYQFTADNKGLVEKRFQIVNSIASDLDKGDFSLLDAYVKDRNTIVVSNFTTETGNLYLYDISGQMIMNETLLPSTKELPLSLNNGAYIMRLQADDKQNSIKLIIK